MRWDFHDSVEFLGKTMFLSIIAFGVFAILAVACRSTVNFISSWVKPPARLHTITDAEGHQLVTITARDVEVKQLPSGWTWEVHRETAVLKARVSE